MPHVTARLDCSICFLLEDGAASWDWVVLVACGHIVHDKCIRQWCNTPISEGSRKKRDTCPTCRAKIIRGPPSSNPSDPHSHSQTSKNGTRFKKAILNVQENVVHSSSPVKRAPGTSPAAVLRNRRTTSNNVVESSEESEQEQEEEEDEAEAGPSNADTSGAGNARQQRENQRIIGEMRALIASKNADLEQKDAQLATQLAQLADLRNKLHLSKSECEDVLRNREIYMNELREAKKDKAQLSRSLEKEVARHHTTRTSLNQRTNEISTLKQENHDLTRRYDRLSKSNEEHLAECEERTQRLEKARQKFEELHQRAAAGNANLKHQHDRERKRRKEAEAKLANYQARETSIGQSAKKVDKGKKRMIYQDEDEEGEEKNQQVKKEEGEEAEDDHFEVPIASTSMSRSRIGMKDYDISAEDSLQIDDFPHSRRMDLHDGYEQDNFDDLDSVHPVNPSRQKARPAIPAWASKKIPNEVDDFFEMEDRKENTSKKRPRDDGILVEIPNKSKAIKGKGKEGDNNKEKVKDRSKSQEYLNQVLTQNSKNLALGDKKRSKYFHK